jgi:hypothetical protein
MTDSNTPPSTSTSATTSAASSVTSLPSMGPEPFRFKPSCDVLEGPAFSRSFQGITLLTVLGSGYWLLSLWQQGKFGGDTGWNGLRSAGWFVMGWALLVWTAWHVLRSRVRIDAQGLHQTWIWDKHQNLDELAYAKLLRVRGLEWLMAPRLYTRTLAGKFTVFYVTRADMLENCSRLAKELETFRRM